VRLRALAALSLLGVGGCAAPPVVMASAGSSAFELGASAWITGKLEAAEPHAMPDVHRAAEDVLHELGFIGVRGRLYEVTGWVHARSLDGRTVRIRMQRTTRGLTKLSVRVGVFGDQSVSVLIHQRIVEKLRPPE
jgi:hypothetical protein